jgi:putative SOS response-associated peptidase YedK
MCGRVVATSSPKELSRYLAAAEVVEVLGGEDYNLAPMGRLPLVWAEERTRDGGRGLTRVLGTARWGLVPKWADRPEVGARMFNARAETVAEKPAFRAAYARRRCLIPVDGFYEWGLGRGSQTKQPWYIYRPDGDPLVLAGLWEHWSPPDTQEGELRTCAVITVPANGDLRPVHHRMPALLPPRDWSDWLDPGEGSRKVLDALLRPAVDGLLSRRRVHRRVNNARNKGPELLEEAIADSDLRPPGQVRLW